jgi:hypothetical protein
MGIKDRNKIKKHLSFLGCRRIGHLSTFKKKFITAFASDLTHLRHLYREVLANNVNPAFIQLVGTTDFSYQESLYRAPN